MWLLTMWAQEALRKEEAKQSVLSATAASNTSSDPPKNKLEAQLDGMQQYYILLSISCSMPSTDCCIALKSCSSLVAEYEKHSSCHPLSASLCSVQLCLITTDLQYFPRTGNSPRSRNTLQMLICILSRCVSPSSRLSLHFSHTPTALPCRY